MPLDISSERGWKDMSKFLFYSTFDIAVTAGFSLAAAVNDSAGLFLSYAGIMILFLTCIWRKA